MLLFIVTPMITFWALFDKSFSKKTMKKGIAAALQEPDLLTDLGERFEGAVHVFLFQSGRSLHP
jgi:hypothetical protein